MKIMTKKSQTSIAYGVQLVNTGTINTSY